MDKFKTPDWLVVGGGALMLISVVMPWTSISFAGVSESGDSPFNYFFTGGIAWLLVVAAGILGLLHVLGKLPDSQPWGLIILGGCGLGALLMILRVILGGRSEFGVDFDRGFGMYVGAIAAIVAAAGAFMNFQAAGGELSDLTDMDKLKESFSGDDDAPPPPPAQ